MNSLIFRFAAPYLTSLMLMFSVFVLLRGHNEPGGGFIGGLIAASAFAILGLSHGAAPVLRAMRFQPTAIAAFGLTLAILAGCASIPAGVAFLSGLWAFPDILGTQIAISTPLVFDIGVYLVVVGTVSTIALALEESEGSN